MASNLRILYNADAWDAATITGSSEENSDLGAANLVHDFIAVPWRTTGDTSENVVFNLGSAVKLTCFAIFAHNFSSGATVTLQGNASDSWGSPTYSQALTIATDADGNVLPRIVFFLDQTFQYWRLLVADATNPDGYIQIGRLMAGEYYEMTRNIAQAWGWQLNDPSEGERIAGRQTYYKQRNKYRTANVNFNYVGQTQVDKMQAIFEKVGNSKPLVVSIDPDNRPTKDSAYCYLATPLGLAHRLIGNFDTSTLVFEEKTE